MPPVQPFQALAIYLRVVIINLQGKIEYGKSDLAVALEFAQKLMIADLSSSKERPEAPPLYRNGNSRGFCLDIFIGLLPSALTSGSTRARKTEIRSRRGGPVRLCGFRNGKWLALNPHRVSTPDEYPKGMASHH